MADNIQKNDISSGEEQFHAAKRAVATLNSAMMSGFKTGESNIENLIRPLYAQYFEVLKPSDDQKIAVEAEELRMRLLYSLYHMRQ
jgi:hypothetical protein